MLKPPFKLAATLADSVLDLHPAGCCERADAAPEAPAPGRARLADLDPHLHCSVIGTCMGTDELRKLMSRFVFVRDTSDLDLHHEAVSMASQGGPVTKALHKALDRRHEATVQRFARVPDAQALRALWDDALRDGEVPGAYWAVLTHRDCTPALRRKAFGDVHMLSHLVGASNRADIRRLAALERDNEALRELAQRQSLRSQALLDERDRTLEGLQRELTAARSVQASVTGPAEVFLQMATEDLAGALALVAVQTERRERAEQAASAALEEAVRLREELAHLGRHAQALGRELAAAEAQLQHIGTGATAAALPLAQSLRGKRIFYVGGRPSSTPAIRDLVLRHGGEFQRHDGGLKDRKGLLASGVAWAELVVFPVDCIDHDSASNLKRLCAKQGVAFLPLRSASVASFAAGLANPSGDTDRPDSPICVRHG